MAGRTDDLSISITVAYARYRAYTGCPRTCLLITTSESKLCGGVQTPWRRVTDPWRISSVPTISLSTVWRAYTINHAPPLAIQHPSHWHTAARIHRDALDGQSRTDSTFSIL